MPWMGKVLGELAFLLPLPPPPPQIYMCIVAETCQLHAGVGKAGADPIRADLRTPALP